ncbi:tetratricopeptide repeat protein [Shewanella cyperi]|uniref:tetratricopeptide repeat protein n=1 Tax=Shewanella cyperi TaxID=2814292 RepID=UPI001A94FF56|nr:hypothetical protein [Shewanella cyperi]QSX42400.1 hypothetical protein JYB84_08410 [Shewanella cyperi]
MWNPFRKKNKVDKTQAGAIPDQGNRVDDLANALQTGGRIKDLESELKKFNQSSLSQAEQESWWHLYGIVAFQDGRDAEALERFKEASARFPESAQIRFSLGQQYIRTQDPEKGFELFRSCKFPDIPREYALAQARYAYVWSRYDDGLMFIRPFFDAYKQLKILDDHFLYVRGLPFFGRWWAYFAAFAILSGELRELESATKFVVENCHDYDFDYLQEELKAYRDDKPEHLLEVIEKRLSTMPEGNFPTGYTRMAVAVIRARAATTFEDAKTHLEGIKLSEQDSPWLEDIRVLALAEAAHRFGEVLIEQENVAAFLKRQPILFEPDIALNFHLLRYQESLKPRVVFK